MHTHRAQCRLCKQPTKLSPREMEVLRELAELRPRLVIAEALGISPKTVENHTRRISDALLGEGEQASVMAVLVAAAEQGVIPPDTRMGRIVTHHRWGDRPVGQVF